MSAQYPVTYDSILGLVYSIADTQIAISTGGGGTPGGADTQVQYNDQGAFAGNAGLKFDPTSPTLTVKGDNANIQFNDSLDDGVAQIGTGGGWSMFITGDDTNPLAIDPTGAGTFGLQLTPSGDDTAVVLEGSGSTMSVPKLGIATTNLSEALTVNANIACSGQLALGPAHPSGACLIDMVNPHVGCGMPAMTTTQKNAITPNRAGNVVFDTDLGKLCVNTGAGWETVTSA